MSKKFVRFDNVALATGIDTQYVTYLEKYILIMLACYSQSDGSNIYPSINKLIKETGLSKTPLKNTFKSLKQKKLIILTNKSPVGSRTPNTYSLNLLLIKSYQLSGSFGDLDRDLSRSPKDLDINTGGLNKTYSRPRVGLNKTPNKVMLNNHNNKCMYVYEKTSVHDFDNEQTIEEQEMINSDSPLYEELIERGLNKKQADEILAIEKTKIGYIQSNSSYFDNQFKNSPEKNNVAMLLTCLRNNWSKFGETVAPPQTAPKPTPTPYVPSSSVSVIDTPLTRKEANNQRFERARAATPEQRIAWMNFAVKIDSYCVLQLENLGLSKNDFIDFNLPGESPDDGKPTLFKSCVTRIMEVIEQSEKRDRQAKESKFQKHVF